MRQQKILIVITKGNWGGAQRYVYDLATNLPKTNFLITVITGEGSILPDKLKEDGVEVFRLPRLGRDVRIGDDLSSFFSLLKIFRIEKPDIVHLNSSKIGGLGALAARIARVKKIIFTAHGWAFNEQRPKREQITIAFLHWLTVVFSHRTIVVSEATKRQLTNWPFIKNKMVVVRNGITSPGQIDRPSARKFLLGDKLSSERGHSRWIGTISELHPNKGLTYLIQAIKNLVDNGKCQIDTLTTVVIGEGEGRDKLQSQIEKSGLEKSFFLIGRKDQAYKYLKALDIFVLTSTTEAFPYTILEAGAAGLPLVASDVGGIAEVVRTMESGITVKPKNPKEIAEAIDFLLNHPAKAEQFGKNLQTRVIKEFSTKRMVKETIGVYNQL